jgi:hypothetical protein
MPKVQRKDIPRALFAHLLLRIEQRSISADALKSLATWLVRSGTVGDTLSGLVGKYPNENPVLT